MVCLVATVAGLDSVCLASGNRENSMRFDCSKIKKKKKKELNQTNTHNQDDDHAAMNKWEQCLPSIYIVYLRSRIISKLVLYVIHIIMELSCC